MTANTGDAQAISLGSDMAGRVVIVITTTTGSATAAITPKLARLYARTLTELADALEPDVGDDDVPATSPDANYTPARRR